MSLNDLPDELLEDIGLRLKSEGDIAALVRSSRRLWSIFIHHLYLYNQEHNLAGALSWAAIRGREDTLIRAHKAGVSISAHLHLLTLAVSHGHPGVVKILLSFPGMEHSYDIHEEMTPLGLAVKKDNSEIVRLLVDYGLDVDAMVGPGYTPALLAAEMGRFEILRILLDHGANLKAKTTHGQSLLMGAAASGSVESVELLLERGVDIAWSNIYGWTCLHSAAQAGRTRVVELLLDRGASISKSTGDGSTALTLAVSKDQLPTIQLLAARGADVNASLRQGETALMMAAERNCIDVMTVLLEHGASTAGLLHGEETCLMIAAAKDFNHAVDLLLKHGADVNLASPTKWTALMEASYRGSGRAVRALLEKGADIEATKVDGCTALFAATCTQQEEVVEILLEHGAGRTLGRKNSAGQTPAIRAAHIGATKLIELFLKAPGFDVDQVDDMGRSALFHAAMRGWPDALRVLLPHSKSANTKDRYGTTPIFAATRNRHHEVVELLLSQGFADATETDMYGKTLLWIASRHGNEKIAAMLRMHTEGAKEGESEGGAEGAGAGAAMGKGKEDAAGSNRGYWVRNRFKPERCWCDVCCRCIDWLENAYECDICEDGKFVACSECATAGFKCQDESHPWKKHCCPSHR